MQDVQTYIKVVINCPQCLGEGNINRHICSGCLGNKKVTKIIQAYSYDILSPDISTDDEYRRLKKENKLLKEALEKTREVC